MPTEADFARALDGLREIWRKKGYRFPAFDRMVADMGPVDATRSVVLATHVPTGYDKLWLRGDLALTIEALIADCRFEDVVGQDAVEAARHRLVQFGYQLPPRPAR